MKYYKFSKISAIWIIIFFIGASITSVFASSNYQIKEEINKLEDQPFHSNIDDPIKEFPSRTKIRIFIFCKIETWTTGRAFLFPGYLDSLDDGINVSKASGLCFVGNKSISDSVKINEIDLANWRWMFIVFILVI